MATLTVVIRNQEDLTDCALVKELLLTESYFFIFLL